MASAETISKEQMEVGGIGCPDGFTLSWDYFSLALIIEGLSEHHRQSNLNKYSGYEVLVVKLRAYIKTLSTSKVSLTSTKGSCNKGQGGKKPPAAASPKFPKCG